MNPESMMRRMLMLAALAITPAAFASKVSVDQIRMEKEAVKLINQLEETARDIHYNSERLSALSRDPRASKWTHVHHLDHIKSLVNDGLRPAFSQLMEMQAHLPEWKQQSIDKMFAAAKALADDANSAILKKREPGGPPPFMNAEYKELIASMNQHSEELLKTSDAAGTYAAARVKADEAGLQIPRK